jgi:L,D-transpeptidase YcbB
LLNKKHKDNKYFEQVNEDYKLLKEQLAKYVQVYKAGGFPSLPASAKDYKPNSSSAAIRLLKRRLQLTGDMPTSDTTTFFDDTLRNAVMQVEQQFGYSPTGKVSTLLIKDLNVPVTNRIEQILINLNRMRWMPREPEGRWILVNIPEFVLHMLDGKNKIFDMNVVVGKEGHNTMMFTGKLSTVVFSPYWNVPPSIVKKELLEKMANNPGFLESQDMEVVGTEGGLPKIRQRPGDKNSLGRVKFLFPNSFNIYFHDSPAKELFNKDKRAYSHGCIRLSEPQKMAEYLLSDNSNWPSSKIYEAMYSGTEQSVSVKKPIPVFITYYTSWVDDNGHIHFRDDIYGRDSLMSSKMFN